MALHAYRSSEPLENTSIRADQALNHRKAFNIIFRLYTHTVLPNLWGIQVYVYSQTLHLNKSINSIIRPHMHTCHSEPLGNTGIHALQIYDIS
jgi:hypothetical protein